MKKCWKFIKTNVKLSLIASLWLALLVYLCYKGEKLLTIMDNNGVLAISGFLLYLIFYVATIERYLRKFANNEPNNDNPDTGKLLKKFYEEREIKGLKKDILDILIGHEYLDKYDENEALQEISDADNGDNRSELTKQMQQAKQNKYNNSYLAFCMLIDRCKEIEDNKQQPYCFQEIAEAFGLEWKWRRYLRYIAWGVLGTMGDLLEGYNKDKQNDNEKIPCVNASVVQKWERDNFNKWFCNGGIKNPNWCCHLPYTSNEGEGDREFILKICKIVKEADDKKILTWKDEYYNLLKEKDSSLKDKKGLDGVYENYKKNGTKMTYDKVENCSPKK